MPRPIYALVAALFAALLLLAGTTSCSRSLEPVTAGPPRNGHHPGPRVVLCPDGSSAPSLEACPQPPPPPPPPPPAMANGGDDEELEPRRPRDGCLNCDRPDGDDYAGSYDESYEMGEPGEGPDAAAVARNPVFKGKAAFVKPEEMEVENWHPLEFYVGPTKAAIEVEAQGRALAEMYDVSLAPTVRVTLLPHPYFKVRKVTPEIQELGTDRTANWKWQVMPMTDGRHKLQALVEVLVLGPDGQPLKKPDGTYRVQDRFDRFVDVDVEVGTWRGFLNAIDNAANLGAKLDTMGRAWDKTLITLVGLIGTIGTLIAAVRKLFGKGKPRRKKK